MDNKLLYVVLTQVGAELRSSIMVYENEVVATIAQRELDGWLVSFPDPRQTGGVGRVIDGVVTS